MTDGRQTAQVASRIRFMIAMFGLAFVLAGCGYRTAGHAATLPSGIHIIAIPGFINQTQSYRIEQTLTAAVVREFTTRTTYRIVNEASDESDAVLKGTVLSAATAPATYDSSTGRVSTVLVTVKMRVSLTDRQGKILFENPEYTFREEYQVSQELSSFFEEQSPAFDRLARDFSHTLVSNVLEGF